MIVTAFRIIIIIKVFILRRFEGPGWQTSTDAGINGSHALHERRL